MTPREKGPTFEEALKRLEEIVALMESGKLTLEEAIERYDEGVKLIALCTHVLDTAEKRIEILSRGEGGQVTAGPFSAEAGGEDTCEKRPDEKLRRPPERGRDDEEGRLLF